jgi:formate-dependent nitrite reductase membrane component NrfD
MELSTMAGHSPEIWGWEIAVYLFLGGLVAGLLVLRGAGFNPRWPYLAPVLLSAGMLALFLDLEHKLHMFRFYTSFQWRSPMSWGAWILLLVFPLTVANAFSLRRRLAAANVALGAALGIYTGILLGTLGARPLWNSPVLGPLFLVSGVSGAAALLYLLERDPGQRRRLASLDVKLMAGEAALLALLLLGLWTGGAAQRAAAALLFGGEFTAVFWVAVVLIGLALPAAIELLERAGRAQHTAYVPVLVLAGGLALRAVILLAGQASHWGNS